MHASVEDSGESVQMCRPLEHFVAHNCVKYKQSHVPAHLTRPACFVYMIRHHLALVSNLGVDEF